MMFRAEHRNPDNGHNLCKIRTFHSTSRGTPIARTPSFLTKHKCRSRRTLLGSFGLPQGAVPGVQTQFERKDSTMTRAFTSAGLVVLFSAALFGQAGITDSGVSGPVFEAADVHVSPKVRVPSMAAGGLRGTRYLVRQATMVDLISLAYDMANSKILAGPSWLDTDRFD